MLRLVFLLLLTAGWCCCGYAQTDFVSSGRCLQFDGVDDYIDLGNIFDDLALPATIEAWVKVDGAPAYVHPIFESQDNLPLYNGVDLAVTATRITGGYGDGRGENSSVYRNGKSQNITSIASKWTHVAIVVRGYDNIGLYVNGVDVGGGYDGSTSLPMSSNSPGDVAKIGYWSANGNIYRFKGSMDEVRVWNRGLTQDQIRNNMCRKLKGDEAGLIGYWSFNETAGTTIEDQSSFGYGGTTKGNPTRVYSGAPIGDNSIYLYPSSWSGNTLEYTIGDETLRVHNVSGNPQGIHIYYINEYPSRTSGIDLSATPPKYFGVFGSGPGSFSYTATYSYKGTAACSIKQRTDNSESTWTTVSGAATTATTPIEIIRTGGTSDVALGADQSTCTGSSITLGPTVISPSATYLWSTGQTSPSIVVSTAGKYWVQVTNACGIARDTVEVSVITAPQASLGEDGILCNVPAILTPVADPTGLTFVWQDGSTTPHLEVSTHGIYWVQVSNACGTDRDTVEVSVIAPPQASLGEDKILCNVPATLTPVADPTGLTFEWQDGSTTPNLEVSTHGIYWVEVSNACGTVRDTVAVSVGTAPQVSLGEDQVLCTVSAILTPVADPTGLTFEWQDASTAANLEVNTHGIYWVQVSNACGTVRDTVEITRKIFAVQWPPNIITPNGDDKNEVFSISVEPEAGAVFLAIYNRWGQRVYKTSDYKNTWTGSGLSDGVYFYHLTGACIEETKGTINILR